jgi:hypothetical protein
MGTCHRPVQIRCLVKASGVDWLVQHGLQHAMLESSDKRWKCAAVCLPVGSGAWLLAQLQHPLLS